MPKLSVYVPEDLWEQAKTHGPAKGGKRSNSQIVQQALVAMVDDQQDQRRSFAEGATRDEARVAAVVEQLRDAARDEYQQGYAAGLELVEALGWHDLRVLMNAGGIGGAPGWIWVSEFDEDEPPGAWARKHGGSFNDGDFYFASEPFQTGANDAVNQVWQALKANSWGTAEPAPLTRANDADEEQVDE